VALDRDSLPVVCATQRRDAIYDAFSEFVPAHEFSRRRLNLQHLTDRAIESQLRYLFVPVAIVMDSAVSAWEIVTYQQAVLFGLARRKPRRFIFFLLKSHFARL
jgi:hypothetical protein